jgi:ABC-2 type transport system permease protein
MSNIATIAKRELKVYFNSPIAYIVVVVFLIISGILFFHFNLFPGKVSSMRAFFTITPLLFVIFAPAVSMRLISEELRSGTLELLTTMPVRDHEVILGKFLAGLAVMCSALVMTLAYAFTVESIGDLDWGPVIGGYLGLILCAAALVSIGLMTSTWSRNQIVAFIFALVIGLVLWLFQLLALYQPGLVGRVLEYFSITHHFQNIARGVIDTRDLLYYFSVTAIALYVAVRSLGRHHA